VSVSEAANGIRICERIEYRLRETLIGSSAHRLIGRRAAGRRRRASNSLRSRAASFSAARHTTHDTRHTAHNTLHFRKIQLYLLAPCQTILENRRAFSPSVLLSSSLSSIRFLSHYFLICEYEHVFARIEQV